MRPTIRVLLVEDDEDDFILAKEYLSGIDTFEFEVDWEQNLDKASKRALNKSYDIYLVDYHLGGGNGLDLVRFLHDHHILAPAIILTGQDNLKVDIDASRSGAADYLVKNELNSSLLERSIRYALSQARIIRELNEKERKYRSLFERSIDPILLATKSLELTDVNDSFVNVFGYSAAEIKGMSLQSLFGDPLEFDRYKETLSETEQIKDFEVKLVSRRGEKKDVLLNCVYIPHPTDELCCIQCIVHDLTLRKQAEKDLIIAERLSLTGRLARTIAHEVRNPLTNLSLALDQLRREIPDEGESGNLYADIIQRNANRIEQLVGEMLRSSKPRELNLQLASVSELLDDTIKLAIDRINLNQIKLELNVESDLPKILVDPDKMHVALLNVIVNATEAMADAGVLRILAVKRGRIITITISDNGRGIEGEDLGRVFDPFFTSKQSGMGLGLTSTRNILNSHCASIDIESQSGKGTDVNVRFTVAE
ncbi:ATP-binding protein [Chryseolinea sp. T2]|uniref:hybrid sensor histidine kinase/response regulator n=1 Tax=Chryseolinea sp. T2 TaxID=3129255 RepID=UPI0030776DA0